MNDLELFRRLAGSEIPVFTNAQIEAILGLTRSRTAVRLNRLVNKGVLIRVMRGRYSLPSTDPLSMASFIYAPSYVSLWSALRYHDATTQSPNVIDVINSTFSGRWSLICESGEYEIRFIKTSPEMLFGFKKVKMGGHVAFMAELEKALIDGLVHPGKIPIEEVLEASRMEVDPKTMMEYAVMTGRQSAIKRCGHILEKVGHDVERPEDLSDTYIRLDPLRWKQGKYDSKWRILDNVV